MAWLLHLMPIVYGTTTYKHVDIEKVEKLHIDACLTGVGGGGVEELCFRSLISIYKREWTFKCSHCPKSLGADVVGPESIC